MRATVMYGAQMCALRRFSTPGSSSRPTPWFASRAPVSAAAICDRTTRWRPARSATMGHEFISLVEDRGSAVRTVKMGDLWSHRCRRMIEVSAAGRTGTPDEVGNVAHCSWVRTAGLAPAATSSWMAG